MEKSLSEQKIRLRKLHRQSRNSISASDRRQWDCAIRDKVLAIPEVVQAERIFIYLSRSGEVDTSALIEWLLRQGRKVLTPSPNISALPHDGLFEISFSPGLLSPMNPKRCLETRVEQLDVIFVPGIVWDANGYRIGFGGGYFDRLLEMAPPDCLKIGLAYDSQIEDEVPRESWDQSVDVLVTQSTIYRKPQKTVLK